MVLSGKFLAPTAAPGLKRRPHLQHPLSRGFCHNYPHQVQQTVGWLCWVPLCAGVSRSPSRAQRWGLLAAGGPYPGHQIQVMGSLGLGDCTPELSGE